MSLLKGIIRMFGRKDKVDWREFKGKGLPYDFDEQYKDLFDPEKNEFAKPEWDDLVEHPEKYKPLPGAPNKGPKIDMQLFYEQRGMTRPKHQKL